MNDNTICRIFLVITIFYGFLAHLTNIITSHWHYANFIGKPILFTCLFKHPLVGTFILLKIHIGISLNV